MIWWIVGYGSVGLIIWATLMCSREARDNFDYDWELVRFALFTLLLIVLVVAWAPIMTVYTQRR